MIKMGAADRSSECNSCGYTTSWELRVNYKNNVQHTQVIKICETCVHDLLKELVNFIV